VLLQKVSSATPPLLFASKLSLVRISFSFQLFVASGNQDTISFWHFYG